jgi:hypothetical protein
MRCILCLLWLLWVPPAYGIEKSSTQVSSFVHQITLKRDSSASRLTQWVSPISVNIPFTKGFLQIRSAAMLVHQNTVPDDAVWGILNTDISGHWSLGNLARLSLIASLPTGKQGLGGSEATLIQNLARNDLNFPVKSFGQGLDYGGSFSLGHHRGHWTWSTGFSYQRKGAYNPLSLVQHYKPGDEMTVSGGLDYTQGSLIYRLSVAGTYYLTDRQDKTVVYQNGKQALIQWAVLYTGNRFQAKAELTEIARLKNQELSSGAFLYETRDSNGNDFRGLLEARWYPIRLLSLYATGYAKHLTANAHAQDSPFYQGDAYLVEGGGGLILGLGPYQVTLGATKLTGKAEDKLVDLSAFNVRFAIAAKF